MKRVFFAIEVEVPDDWDTSNLQPADVLDVENFDISDHAASHIEAVIVRYRVVDYREYRDAEGCSVFSGAQAEMDMRGAEIDDEPRFCAECGMTHRNSEPC